MNKFYEYSEYDINYNERWYVVGDIHGCLKQLNEMVELIKNDIHTNGRGRYNKVIFVGDYIDRGPDSYGVIERVFNLKHNTNNNFDIVPYANTERTMVDVITLRGNHEQMLLDAINESYNEESLSSSRLSDHSSVGLWSMNGGLQTARSYCDNMKTENMLMPPHHIRFYNETAANYYLDHCGPNNDQTWMIVHAGVDYCYPLSDQVESIYLWIRNQYINYNFDIGDYHDGKLRVISGHTPVKEFVQTGGKVLLDTACVFGNKLTCCVFETKQEFKPVKVIQVDNPVDYTKIKH